MTRAFLPTVYRSGQTLLMICLVVGCLAGGASLVFWTGPGRAGQPDSAQKQDAAAPPAAPSDPLSRRLAELEAGLEKFSKLNKEQAEALKGLGEEMTKLKRHIHIDEHDLTTIVADRYFVPAKPGGTLDKSGNPPALEGGQRPWVAVLEGKSFPDGNRYGAGLCIYKKGTEQRAVVDVGGSASENVVSRVYVTDGPTGVGMQTKEGLRVTGDATKLFLNGVEVSGVGNRMIIGDRYTPVCTEGVNDAAGNPGKIPVVAYCRFHFYYGGNINDMKYGIDSSWGVSKLTYVGCAHNKHAWFDITLTRPIANGIVVCSEGFGNPDSPEVHSAYAIRRDDSTVRVYARDLGWYATDQVDVVVIGTR